MPTVEILIPLPDVDEWKRPKAKLPNCPNCGQDELSMTAEDRAVCNTCNCLILKQQPGLHILDVPAVCGNCPWMGTVQACEPSDNGDLMCPQCGEEIVIRVDSKRNWQ